MSTTTLQTHRGVTTVLSSIALAGVTMILFGSAMVSPAHAQAAPNVTVTIDKYINGAMATAASANSGSFPMTATWDATNIGAGTGTYSLGADGTPQYQAMTVEMSSGANYSTEEVTGGELVGASCSTGQPYALVGYTSGATLAEAQSATPTMTAPAFTGMTESKFVIVWNQSCPPPAPPTEKITVIKYLDGIAATASSTNSAIFTMNATWNDPQGIGAGTGTYTLSPDGTPAYEAQTIDMNPGASYSTDEQNDAVVGATCAAGTPFTLLGYTTGSTREEATSGTPTATAPAFTNLSGDEYVIVWNKSCSSSGDGSIGGDVTGGQSEHGTLEVTSVTATQTTATANGTFESGWKYLFNITVPDNETNLAMKFADWMSTVGSHTIAVANNVRISSAQADNSNATVMVTAANTYTSPALHITGDLNSGLSGKQIQVVVEAAVPAGSFNGSYTTSYGVRTLP